MEISFKRQLINPELPVYLEGYGKRLSKSIHDDLEINSFMMKQGQAIMVHVLDVIMIEKEFSNQVKEVLFEKFALKPEQVIIEAVHTHSAPKVSKRFMASQEVEGYLNLLQEKIIENTEYCLDNLKKAELSFTNTTVNNAFSNRNNQEIPYNNNLYLYQFKTKEQENEIDFLNMACHPTILSKEGTDISSDLVGQIRRDYEEETGRKLIVTNGECGDISTRFTRQGDDFKEVKRVSQLVIKSLLKASEKEELKTAEVIIKKSDSPISYEPQKEAILIAAKQKIESVSRNTTEDNLISGYINSKLSQEKITIIPESFIYDFNSFVIVTVPGELVSELGKRIRESTNKKVIILAYSNDFLGYAVNKEQFGQYFESFLSEYPAGGADQFVDDIINRIKGA